MSQFNRLNKRLVEIAGVLDWEKVGKIIIYQGDNETAYIGELYKPCFI